MIHVVDQKIAGLWPIGGLKPRVGGLPLRPAAPDPGLSEPYGACAAGRFMVIADAGHDRPVGSGAGHSGRRDLH
jgi:hypothetical protein